MIEYYDIILNFLHLTIIDKHNNDNITVSEHDDDNRYIFIYTDLNVDMIVMSQEYVPTGVA